MPTLEELEAAIQNTILPRLKALEDRLTPLESRLANAEGKITALGEKVTAIPPPTPQEPRPEGICPYCYTRFDVEFPIKGHARTQTCPNRACKRMIFVCTTDDGEHTVEKHRPNGLSIA